MNLNHVKTMNYENERLAGHRKNEPKTNPIYAKTNPISNPPPLDILQLFPSARQCTVMKRVLTIIEDLTRIPRKVS